ncbi:hypothetical protein [Paenibacillus lautus]|uniref:hypothetical protein n=1 Tax=Paenibacillus lautus TaxID=1401 RepID=UPI003987406E
MNYITIMSVRDGQVQMCCLVCLDLLATLQRITWIGFVVTIYAIYGYRHSNLPKGGMSGDFSGGLPFASFQSSHMPKGGAKTLPGTALWIAFFTCTKFVRV